jgi:phage recombination protein Bet
MPAAQTDSLDKVVGMTSGYDRNQILLISKQIAKGANATELAYFLNVCKSQQLNPFNKEIWCYKDHQSNLIIFTGRDGMLAKAQKNPDFQGIRSMEYCEKDETVEIDIPNGIINHKFDPRKERGNILGAYAYVYRSNGEPTIEVADFKTYNKGRHTWKSHPAQMIKKVAEASALKKAFGLSGIQMEHDFEVRNDVAIPLQVDKDRITKEDLSKAYDAVYDKIPEEQKPAIERVIFEEETESYTKVLRTLNSFK